MFDLDKDNIFIQTLLKCYSEIHLHSHKLFIGFNIFDIENGKTTSRTLFTI